jgi:hypothetical protein
LKASLTIASYRFHDACSPAVEPNGSSPTTRRWGAPSSISSRIAASNWAMAAAGRMYQSAAST